MDFDNYLGGHDDDSGTVFRDVILLTLAGFVVIVLLLLPHINPITKKTDEDIASPGNVLVEMFWDDQAEEDIDLWVKGPGDMPVGYSNKSGILFNLLRDDLGQNNDMSNRNYENAFSRGMPAGEYIVNVHFYRARVNTVYPIEVRIVISTKKNPGDSSNQIIARTIYLGYEGEETTVVRFRLNDKGRLDPSSINDIYTPLRSFDDE